MMLETGSSSSGYRRLPLVEREFCLSVWAITSRDLMRRLRGRAVLVESDEVLGFEGEEDRERSENVG